MTNKDLQRKLDFEKWCKGIEQQRDPSGDMKYCYFCDCCIDGTCVELQEYREAEMLCAKAYRRSRKKK